MVELPPDELPFKQRVLELGRIEQLCPLRRVSADYATRNRLEPTIMRLTVFEPTSQILKVVGLGKRKYAGAAAYVAAGPPIFFATPIAMPLQGGATDETPSSPALKLPHLES